jgi:sulfur carrier protein
MAQELQLIVNGRERKIQVDPPLCLSSVLNALELKADRIAVEQNGRIVRRSAWQDTPVGNGDKLEVVHFVGGGASTLL